MEGSWVSLMEYATRRGVSLSTLRRYIKAGKILYRSEAGRYLVFDEQPEPIAKSESPQGHHPLERDLQKAREEIAELKTLIAFYEEQLSENPRTST